MANQKLAQEELQAIAQLQQQNQIITTEFGTIELLKMSLDARRKAAEEALTQVRKTEQELVGTLQSKYGEGTIDLASGEFVASAAATAPAPEMPVLEKAE